VNLPSGFLFFQNSSLLPLLALALVPLLLHLFSKVKPPKFLFSSNDLLRKIIKNNEKIKKPHDLLLLLIRTLIFLFVILIFLKPIYFSQSSGMDFFKPKSLVIIVDASASMAYNSNGQTRFASACAEANHIISGLSSKDKADIIFLKANPETVFPTPATNFAYMKQKLASAAVSNEYGAVRPAMKKALELLKDETGRRKEISVISDFQTTQWQTFFDNPELPEEINMTFIKTGNEHAANYAASSSAATPATPLPGDNIVFSCEIFNYSNTPQEIPVYFHSGAIYKHEKISVPPWQSSEVSLSLPYDSDESRTTPFTKPGYYSYTFSIDEDAFPDDNIHYGIVKTGTNLTVGLVNFNNSNSLLPRALKSLNFLDTQTTELNDSLLDETPDFIFINNWNGKNSKLIKNLTNAGTALFIFPAPEINIESLNKIKNKLFSSKNSNQIVRMQNADAKPFKLHLNKPDDKAFKLFADGDYGDPANAIVKQRLLLPTKINATVLMDYTDKIPALIRIENPKGAPVYIWNIPLNTKYSNFTKKIQFIPILGELLLTARATHKKLAHLINYPPGSLLTLNSDNITGLSNKISLQNEQGETFKTIPRNSNGREILTTDAPVKKPGIYSWQLRNQTIQMNQVNFPASESDLRTLPDKLLKKLGGSVNAGSGEIDALRSGYNLLPLLFILALLAALTEGAVMLRSEFISKKLNREE